MTQMSTEGPRSSGLPSVKGQWRPHDFFQVPSFVSTSSISRCRIHLLSSLAKTPFTPRIFMDFMSKGAMRRGHIRAQAGLSLQCLTPGLSFSPYPLSKPCHRPCPITPSPSPLSPPTAKGMATFLPSSPIGQPRPCHHHHLRAQSRHD